MNNIKHKIEKFIPKLSLIIITIEPFIDWLINCIKTGKYNITDIYTMWDIHLVFIFYILNLIYDSILNHSKEQYGDESNILLNRNQSDYYEIWEACKGNRNIKIDAYGHSFKTLWYNFIKKFLNESIININNFDQIQIKLISTQKNNNCFEDIIDFYNTLPPNISSKIKIFLTEVDELTFFTGICVNNDYLWLSIREPHSTNKTNEHVREWKRKNNVTSVKIIDWFLGIIKYYFDKFPGNTLG